jgi:hypothetical protein
MNQSSLVVEDSRLAGMSVKLALEDTGTKFLTVPVG